MNNPPASLSSTLTTIARPTCTHPHRQPVLAAVRELGDMQPGRIRLEPRAHRRQDPQPPPRALRDQLGLGDEVVDAIQHEASPGGHGVACGDAGGVGDVQQRVSSLAGIIT